jgi:hypothetical protein
MSFHGRSLDDLPLAAYTTGAGPDEDESLDSAVDPDLVEAPAPTQQELAAALADSVAAVSAPEEKKSRRPRPSLKLPSLRRSRTAALQQAAPFQPAAAGGPAVVSFQSVSATPAGPAAPTYQPAASFQAAPAFEPVSRPGVAEPGLPKVGGAKRARPRLALRNPRVLAGGVVVVGLGLLGFSLLGGGLPGGGSAGSNPTQDPGAAVATAPPGNASVELTDAMPGIHALTGATGAGPAVDSQLNATWTNVLGESLWITGLASQGTRTTDPNFVLSWTMLIDNLSVTFTSRNAECTVGMAVGPKAIHGTFVCKKLKSGDGKHVIDLRGTYQT